MKECITFCDQPIHIPFFKGYLPSIKNQNQYKKTIAALFKAHTHSLHDTDTLIRHSIKAAQIVYKAST